jgi:hypothetical protein
MEVGPQVRPIDTELVKFDPLDRDVLVELRAADEFSMGDLAAK